jgi:hypothetical protein
MTDPNVTGDGRTVTIRIRISIRKRGGRKLVLAPDGTPDAGPVRVVVQTHFLSLIGTQSQKFALNFVPDSHVGSGQAHPRRSR